jgi:hypothetical protein
LRIITTHTGIIFPAQKKNSKAPAKKIGDVPVLVQIVFCAHMYILNEWKISIVSTTKKYSPKKYILPLCPGVVVYIASFNIRFAKSQQLVVSFYRIWYIRFVCLMFLFKYFILFCLVLQTFKINFRTIEN